MRRGVIQDCGDGRGIDNDSQIIRGRRLKAGLRFPLVVGEELLPGSVERVRRRTPGAIQGVGGVEEFVDDFLLVGETHPPQESWDVLCGEMFQDPGVLARHKDPKLTMNVYGRANAERLRAAVEKLGETIDRAEAERISQRDDKRVLVVGVGAIPMITTGFRGNGRGDRI